jgi:hypothetical protein
MNQSATLVWHGHPENPAREPLEVVLPDFKGDHETLSILGHVGFYVIFSSIVNLGHS